MDAVFAPLPQGVSGRPSPLAAMQMDPGNLISVLHPPSPLPWFGGPTSIDALHRYRPNPRVGHRIRGAAPRSHTPTGAVMPIGTSFPGRGLSSGLTARGAGLDQIIPSPLLAILCIRRSTGTRFGLPTAPTPAEEPSS